MPDQESYQVSSETLLRPDAFALYNALSARLRVTSHSSLVLCSATPILTERLTPCGKPPAHNESVCARRRWAISTASSPFVSGNKRRNSSPPQRAHKS